MLQRNYLNSHFEKGVDYNLLRCKTIDKSSQVQLKKSKVSVNRLVHKLSVANLVTLGV